jgi:hypothetical protein
LTLAAFGLSSTRRDLNGSNARLKHVQKPASSDCRRWRKAFRALGSDHLNFTMAGRNVGPDADAPVFGVVNVAPHPTRAFVEAWLVANKRRVGTHTVALRIVAVFSVAAALGSVIEKNWGTISHLVGWS